jgi:hypothetical protein
MTTHVSREFQEEEYLKAVRRDRDNKRASDWSKERGVIATKQAIAYADKEACIEDPTDKSLLGFPTIEAEVLFVCLVG